jgi:prepilin-type N-terminal cleavage/methylation domain-containing protein
LLTSPDRLRDWGTVRALLPHPRAGLTLLELLVVLVILAITTTVVPLVWRAPRAAAGSALDRLTQSARRDAIRRGEELRLRVDADGVWVLGARNGAAILDTGRIAPPVATVSLRIDALGTCRPGADAGADAGAGAGAGADAYADAGASFDMLACRYRPPATATLGVAP